MEHCNLFFSFFLALFFLVFATTSYAFNITKILEKQSDFSNFNNLLSETKLADEINRRSTITVLAVDNGAAGGLSGRPSDQAKKILSVHVVLDYYDQDKLKKIFKSNKSATLTTLYQTTGQARHEQGFIKVSVKDGQISFGSASKGAHNSVNLVKSVVSQPYNLSVLQVGSIIDVPDIESSSSAPASSPKSANAPSPSKSKKDDSDAPSPSDDDDSDSDSSSGKAPAPSKHKGKDKSSPPSPDDDSSADSAPAPTPSAPAPSAASRTLNIKAVGAGVVMMGLTSLLAA